MINASYPSHFRDYLMLQVRSIIIRNKADYSRSIERVLVLSFA